MASANKCYPDYLNPFGSDEEGDVEEEHGNESSVIKPVDEYPDYLSPFDDIDDQEVERTTTAIKTLAIDDYDDSLNPFGDEDENLPSQQSTSKYDNTSKQQVVDDDFDLGEGNPFAEDLKEESENVTNTPVAGSLSSDQQMPSIKTEITNEETTAKAIPTTATMPQEQETPDKPPVPLPRTKSLLKKELAAQRLKQQQQQQQLNILETSNHANRSSNSDSLLESEER